MKGWKGAEKEGLCYQLSKTRIDVEEYNEAYFPHPVWTSCVASDPIHRP